MAKNTIFLIFIFFVNAFIFSQNKHLNLSGISGFELYNNKLYFTEPNEGNIYSINSNGDIESLTLIKSGLNYPINVTIKNNIIYTTELILGNIVSIDLNDTTQTDIVFSGLKLPYDLLFLQNDLIVSEENSISKINIANKSKILLTNKVNRPYGIEVKDSIIYIAEWNAHKISKLNLKNNQISDLITSISHPSSLTFKDNIMYYTETVKGSIGKYDLDNNKNTKDFYTKIFWCHGLIIINNHIFCSIYGGKNSLTMLSLSPILINSITNTQKLYKIKDTQIDFYSPDSITSLSVIDASGKLIDKKDYLGDSYKFTRLKTGTYYLIINNTIREKIHVCN